MAQQTLETLPLSDALPNTHGGVYVFSTVLKFSKGLEKCLKGTGF
jgi:hypothetical protein